MNAPDSSADELPEQGELFERPPRRRRGLSMPSFAADGTRRALRGNRRWWALAAMLALTLSALSLLAERDRLATDARFRPWLAAACERLGCRLPPWQEPQAFRILTRDVRPHPSVPGALLITATFRNDAAWPQAWPRLQLSLQNLDGREVAQRRFDPAEYLGGPPAQPVLGAGQSASLTLEVVDPGREAIAFTFDFL